jgi:hypothetical protein
MAHDGVGARVSTNQFSAQVTPDNKKVLRSRDAEDIELMNLLDEVKRRICENSNNDICPCVVVPSSSDLERDVC